MTRGRSTRPFSNAPVSFLRKDSHDMSTAERADARASSTSPSSSVEPPEELREQLTAQVAELLKIEPEKAQRIVDVFDERVAQKLERKFATVKPHDLAKRNTFFYAVLGVSSIDDWINRALADTETSALEGYIGTWLEDVARIVSGGTKPASGVDLQRDVDDDNVELYSLQMAGNTKSAGGAVDEIRKLRAAAAALRAHGKHVTTYVGVMFGRRSSKPSGADPNILKPASEGLWNRLTGQQDFLPRLLDATRLLSVLVKARTSDDAARLVNDATGFFAAADGTLDLAKLADPPKRPRVRKKTS